MDFGRSSPCVLSRSISQLLYSPLHPTVQMQSQVKRISSPLPGFQVKLKVHEFTYFHIHEKINLFYFLGPFERCMQIFHCTIGVNYEIATFQFSTSERGC